MPDEKNNKSRVVVRGEGSCHVEGSGAAPDIVVSLYDQFPPDPPIAREAVVSRGDVRRRLDDEGTEADDESEIISVGGPLSIVGGCESEGVTFEEAVGRAGLISETENALDTAGEPARKSVRGCGEQFASGSEFEVGGATSGEDFPRRASRRAPLAAVAES